MEKNNNSNKKVLNLFDVCDLLHEKNFIIDKDEDIIINSTTKRIFRKLGKEEYEKINDLLQKYVQTKLAISYNMNQLEFSLANFCKSYLLISNDFLKNDKLVVIIPNKGDIYPGVFNIASLFYRGIEKGSMISLINTINSQKFSTLIMNPNKLSDKAITITDFSDHISHCQYIWKEFISKNKSKFSKIVVVADQYAGLSIIKLIKNFSTN